MTLSPSVQTRLSDVLNRPGRRKILGIAGPPGSGKSTLAAQIAEHLGMLCQVVPMDGFHLAQQELERLGLASRKGSPPSFDSAGYAALLERIALQGQTGEVVYAPTFQREIEEPIAGAIAVLPQTELIVTEGNYVLLKDGAWARVKPWLTATWYVDVDPQLRRGRLLARHMQFGRDAQAAMAWMENNDDLNATLIEGSKGRADWIVA